MTEKLEVYKCEICGNIVEVLHKGAGQLVCCGEPMRLIEEKTKEEGDPDGGIKPGTPFENLPEDWVCPVCGAGKAKFEKEI